MTQFVWKPKIADVGVAPSDLTYLVSAMSSEIVVQDNSGVLSVYTSVNQADSTRRFLTPVGAPSPSGVVEVLVDWANEVNTGNEGFGPAVYSGTSDATLAGVWSDWDRNAQAHRIRQRTSGADVNIATEAVARSLQRRWIRTQFDTVNKTVKSRHWNNGTTEPTTWLEGTWTASYSFDKIGARLFNNTGGRVRIYSISIGTNGDPAPDPNATPQPPQGTTTVTGVTPSYTQAVVSFTYSPGTDYTGFQYRINGGIPATLGTSPALVTGLMEETPYDIEVRAVNSHGEGAWSAVYNFTTTATPEAPSTAPTGIIGDSDGPYKIDLAWNSMVDATGYDVEVDGVVQDNGANTSFSHTGLLAESTHNYRVRAYNNSGDGPWSSVITVTTEAVTGNAIRLTLGLTQERGANYLSSPGWRYTVFGNVNRTSVLASGTIDIPSTGIMSIDVSNAPWMIGDEVPVLITREDGNTGTARTVWTFFGYVVATEQA